MASRWTLKCPAVVPLINHLELKIAAYAAVLTGRAHAPDGHSKCFTYGQSNCSTPTTATATAIDRVHGTQISHNSFFGLKWQGRNFSVKRLCPLWGKFWTRFAA